MSKLKVINLFAGPGAGKSTIRAELFSRMKRKSMLVEEVTEFAKDLTWDKSFDTMSDQLFLLANQNRRQFRLVGQVDWMITDAPILLGLHYVSIDYLPKYFDKILLELWDTYDNYNFFINRNKPYLKVGRTQTEEEAKHIDVQILNMLDKYSLPYISIVGDSSASDNILEHILGTR